MVKLPTHCCVFASTVCLCMRASAELFASSMTAPDLGGGAQAALLVTDGPSDLGYRSQRHIEPLTAVPSHAAAVRVQRCSWPGLTAKFMCLLGVIIPQRACDLSTLTTTEILQYSVRFFFYV